jgi:6-pyruvoyltetrahydropterin/6-carboxytetrahydropterin synthase
MWIELDGWQAKLRFSACHFIPNHPKCGHLHGHTYAISVKIVGQQIGNFVVDFEDLKRYVGEICETLDHKTLLASRDESTQITKTETGDIAVTVGTSRRRYCFPKEDVVMLPINSVSAEDLCSHRRFGARCRQRSALSAAGRRLGPRLGGFRCCCAFR